MCLVHPKYKVNAPFLGCLKKLEDQERWQEVERTCQCFILFYFSAWAHIRIFATIQNTHYVKYSVNMLSYFQHLYVNNALFLIHIHYFSYSKMGLDFVKLFYCHPLNLYIMTIVWPLTSFFILRSMKHISLISNF